MKYIGYPFLKRLADIFLALLIFALIFPLLLLVSILILITLGRPVFFRQQRIGRNCQEFCFIKFRTMTDCRDGEGKMLPDADRMTKIGNFLRRTSVDELPSLWCVLSGSMSLIGPRPLLPEYLALYSKEQNKRHNIRPGITGLAQVRGRNNLSWKNRFRYDVWYVKHVSLMLDFKIICETFQTVLSGDGVSKEGHVTMEKFMGK